MKTLVRISNNVSYHSIDDNETVVMTNENVLIGDPVRLIIEDQDINNSILYENVIFPNGWANGKFKYDGQTWTLNPDYIE